MKWTKQSGFSLLEIMVAAALLGGLALTGAKLMESQTKSMKTIEVRGEYTAVLAEIRSVLAIESSCIDTFPNTPAANTDPNPAVPGVVTSIKQKPSFTASITKFQSATNPADWRTAPAYGNGNVRILSFKFADVNISPTPAPDGSRIGSLNLVVRMQSGVNKTVGAEVLERKIPMSIEVINAANNIRKCSSSGTTGLDARYLIRSEGGDVFGPINMINDGIGPASNINMNTGTSLNALSGANIQALAGANFVAMSGSAFHAQGGANMYLNNGSAFTAQLGSNMYVSAGANMSVGGNILLNNGGTIQAQAGSVIYLTPNSRLVGQNQSAIIMQDSSYIDFTSDARFKEDIRPFKNLSTKLRKLRPVSYKWKSSGDEAYGVIAQELMKVFPKLVRESGPDNSLTVNYIQMIPLLIQGFQEVDKENVTLKASLTKLQVEQRKQNEELKELKKYLCQGKSKPTFCTSNKR